MKLDLDSQLERGEVACGQEIVGYDEHAVNVFAVVELPCEHAVFESVSMDSENPHMSFGRNG